MPTTELTAVSVVVPAYQEAASIGPAVTRLAEVLDGTGRPYEILVVSDGSSDGTADEARIKAVEALHPHALLRKPVEFGDVLAACQSASGP